MVIVITLTESDNQIISGIPEYVELTTNTSSTIFYTLDGTTPDSDSDIYVEKLYLPTDQFTVTLKAFAVAGEATSAVLEQEYTVSQVKLNRSRLVGDEGINILPPGDEIVDHLSFDYEGSEAQTSTISFSDLDLRASTTDSIGQGLLVDTTIDFINFAQKQTVAQTAQISSPTSSSFDPRANYIIIDGYSPDAIPNQVVRIINRPHGSMDLLSRINQKSEEFQLNTSSFVRSMVNPRTGKITFYYRDSRENRWISSTQEAEIKCLNLSPTSGPPNSFVFKWIEHRHGTKIY